MVSRWTKYRSHSSPCECTSPMEFSCSNISTHVLDCVLRITSHPIRMISASANLFWLAAFGSHDASLILRLTPFVPTLFMSWRRSLRKEGFPNDSGVHSEWARGVFDSDEYSGFFAKYRSEVIRCLNLANSHWPVEILQMITALVDDLLKTSCTTTGDFESRDECPSSLVCDWDVLELFIESTLASIKDGFAVRGQIDQFDHTSSALLRQFLQVPFSMDPNLRGKQIMCACVLMQHVDSRHDAELLIPLLSQIFACFRFNPTTNGAGPNVSVLRSKPVVDMHMSTASAFFRLTRSCPERVMTHFDGIGTEVTNLWADPNCGMVEKCVLLEALILLCLRLPQSIEVQRDLLKQLVSHVTSAWSTPTPTSESTPMLRLLTSCATGGSGLVSILGLDQPISAHQDFQSPYVQMRITFGQNVLALLATSRRLSEPANSQQLQQITVPLLEPVVSSVFIVVRAFNELWLPDTRALVHPSVLPAFEMTEHVKYTLLSLQIGRTDKRHLPEPKTPLERIRSSLYEHHENLLTIVGLLFTGLSPSLYHLPTDQLAVLLHQGCCAAFEHLPDLKLNSLLRLVIRQFIRGCPKEYLSTALVPLIPPVIEAVVQRLDSRWNQVTQMNHEGALDDKAVACELVEERLARLMSRTLMDMLRLIYTFNGCESLVPQSDGDQVDGDDGMEDINMQADTKSTTSVGPGHDVRTIGALARALITAPTIDPQVTTDSSAFCSDPLFLQCLSKCLTWPDSATCFKASQWIPTLIDALVQPVANGATSIPLVKRPLAGPLAEAVLFGVLCGLHVNGKNAETNLSSLLLAGVRVYTSVDVSVACGGLRELVTKVLISASSSDTMQSTQSVQLAVQNFESKLFEKSKPLADKAKRDVFRKLVQPIIGIPLSQRFRDHVAITTSLAPLARSKWRHPARNGDSSFPDSFGLSELFSS
ncbi:Exportin-5 [Paragonimus heterotremus]|uniref:Exportin-5 n=1 Tax=Paragonimus heterotremus TaxID=100268 RepID=A0A8J4WHL2_9TREM|nr:Exportin-5 [Paragonimus heterotremus]